MFNPYNQHRTIDRAHNILYLLWRTCSHGVKCLRVYLESRLRKNLDYLASSKGIRFFLEPESMLLFTLALIYN
jgi:hypothetical protein